MQTNNAVKFISNLAIKCSLLSLLSITAFLPGIKADAQLAYTLNNNGLATLSYNGTSLLDIGSVNPVPLHGVGTPIFSPDIGDNGQSTPTSSTLSGSTVSQTYVWGTITTAYAQTGNTLKITVTVHNTTSATMTTGDISVGILQFPTQPTGSMTDSPASPMGNQVLAANPTFEPPVVVFDYGTGAVDFCNENVNDGITARGGGCWNSGTFTQYNCSADFSNLASGATKTAVVSYRFGASGTGDSMAADIYGKYSAYYPYQLQWDDRRMIGTNFHSTSTQPHPATNPRGWFLNDTTIDVTTTPGLQNFKSRMLSYADSTISQLQTMGCQGVIFWDIEGQQYAQPAVSYVGDPRLIPTMAPEWEYNDGTGTTINAYIKKYTDAGYKIGFTLRPTHCDQSTGQWNQNVVSNIPAELEAKIAWVLSQWPTTSLFYVDSNVDASGGTDDPSIFQQVAAAYPNVLIIPEHHSTRYYAYTMGFGSFNSKGITQTIPGIYNAYPGAASFIYAPTDSGTYGTLASNTSAFQFGCSHGDLMSFHSWFPDPSNPTVLSIFNGAGMGPAARITSPASGASVGSNFTISVTATPASGKTISKVDFYQSTTSNGTVLLGTDTTSPYSYTWNGAPAGSYVLTAKATDSAGLTRTCGAVLVTVVNAPVITSALTKSGTAGTALAYNITATNSPTSYGASPLPPGLSVNTGTGLISGTPTTTGTTNTSISATNAGGTGSTTLVFTIVAGIGSLVGSGALGSGAINLTTEGAIDWGHWGLTTVSTWDHKSTGGSQITNYTQVGTVAAIRYTNDVFGATWTDGTPDAAATNSTTGIYIKGLNNGFSITVPADTTTRTLKFYCGGYFTGGTITAHLSDSSASDYVNSSFSNAGAAFSAVYTLTYKAGSAGKTLNVKWLQNTSAAAGNVTLISADLH